MSSQTITLELPDHIIRMVNQLVQASQRPAHEILQDLLAHSLPPLDDVPPEEAESLAQLSMLDDASLWQASRCRMPERDQETLDMLLDMQSAGALTPDDATRLQELMDEYGLLLVRQAHAWLLLARRGYTVPLNPQPE